MVLLLFDEAFCFNFKSPVYRWNIFMGSPWEAKLLSFARTDTMYEVQYKYCPHHHVSLQDHFWVEKFYLLGLILIFMPEFPEKSISCWMLAMVGSLLFKYGSRVTVPSSSQINMPQTTPPSSFKSIPRRALKEKKTLTIENMEHTLFLPHLDSKCF